MTDENTMPDTTTAVGGQSDIFDHLLAIVGEFGLRLFQDPSGADFGQALNRPDR